MFLNSAVTPTMVHLADLSSYLASISISACGATLTTVGMMLLMASASYRSATINSQLTVIPGRRIGSHLSSSTSTSKTMSLESFSFLPADVTDGSDFSLKGDFWESIQSHNCLLVDANLAHVRFVDAGLHAHLPQIRQSHQGLAGPELIAHMIVWA